MRIDKIVNDAEFIFKRYHEGEAGVDSLSVANLPLFLKKNFKFFSNEYLFAVCYRYLAFALGVKKSGGELDDSRLLKDFIDIIETDLSDFIGALEDYKFIPPILFEMTKHGFNIFTEACDVFLGDVTYEFTYKDSMDCLYDLLQKSKNVYSEYRDTEDIYDIISHEIENCKREIAYIEGDKSSKSERLQAFIIYHAFETLRGRENE